MDLRSWKYRFQTLVLVVYFQYDPIFIKYPCYRNLWFQVLAADRTQVGFCSLGGRPTRSTAELESGLRSTASFIRSTAIWFRSTASFFGRPRFDFGRPRNFSVDRDVWSVDRYSWRSTVLICIRVRSTVSVDRRPLCCRFPDLVFLGIFTPIRGFVWFIWPSY